MTKIRGVLEGRGTAAAAFILFSGLAAWSWASITSSHQLLPVHLGGLLFSAFITGSIAYRSPLSVDRIAFGAVTVAFLLTAVAARAPLSRTALLVLGGAESLMWTFAAAVALAALVRGSQNAHKDS